MAGPALRPAGDSAPLPPQQQQSCCSGSSGSVAAEEPFAELLQRVGAPAALLSATSSQATMPLVQRQKFSGRGAGLLPETQQAPQEQQQQHLQEHEGVRELSSAAAAAAATEEEPFSYRTACSSPLSSGSPCSRSCSKSSSAAAGSLAGGAAAAVVADAGELETNVFEAATAAAAAEEEAAAAFAKSSSSKSSSSNIDACSLSSSLSTTLVLSDADLKLLAASPPSRGQSSSSCTPYKAEAAATAGGSGSAAAAEGHLGQQQQQSEEQQEGSAVLGSRRREDSTEDSLRRDGVAAAAATATSETPSQTQFTEAAAAEIATTSGGTRGGLTDRYLEAAAATQQPSAPCSPISSAGSVTVPEFDDLDVLLSAGSGSSKGGPLHTLQQRKNSASTPCAAAAAGASAHASAGTAAGGDAAAAAARGEWSLLSSDRRGWEDMRRADARAAAAVDERHLEDAGKKTIWVIHQGFCTPVSWYEDTSVEDVQAAVLCACDVMLDDEDKEETAAAAVGHHLPSAAADFEDAQAAARRALRREEGDRSSRPAAAAARQISGGFVLRQVEPLPHTAEVDSSSLFLDVCVLQLRCEENSSSPIAYSAPKDGTAAGPAAAGASSSSSSSAGPEAAAAASSAAFPGDGALADAAGGASVSASAAAAKDKQQQQTRLLRVVKGRRVRFEEFGELVSGCTYLLERVGLEEAFFKETSSSSHGEQQQQTAQGTQEAAAADAKKKQQQRLVQSLAGNRWRRLLVPVQPLLHIESQKAFQRMMRGANLLKHTRYGYPHLRQFQLSADRRRLLWYTSSKTKDSSVLHLPLLHGIILGQKTQTFLSYRLPALQHLSFSLVFLAHSGAAAAAAATAVSSSGMPAAAGTTAAAGGCCGAGGSMHVGQRGSNAAAGVGTTTTKSCCRRTAAGAAAAAVRGAGGCLRCRTNQAAAATGEAAEEEEGTAAAGHPTRGEAGGEAAGGEAAATEKREGEQRRAAAAQEEWVRQQIELQEVPPGARTVDLTCKDEFEYDYWVLGFKAVTAANKGLLISKKLLLSHSRRFRRALAQNHVTFKLTALPEVREPGQVGLEECMDLPWHPPDVLQEKYEGLQSRIQAAAAEIRRIDYHQLPMTESLEAEGPAYAAVYADAGQDVVDDASMEQRRMSELLLQVFQLLADARHALKAFNVESCAKKDGTSSCSRRRRADGSSSDEKEVEDERQEGSRESEEGSEESGGEAVVVSISSAGDIKTRPRNRRCGVGHHRSAAAAAGLRPSTTTTTAAAAPLHAGGGCSSSLSFEEQFRLNSKKSVAAASLEAMHAVQEQVKGGVMQLLQQAGPLTQEAQKLLENAVSLAAAAVSGRLEEDSEDAEAAAQQNGQAAAAAPRQRWSPEELQQLKTINQLLWKAEVDLENVEDMLARSQQSDSPLAPVNIVASVSHLNQKLSDELQRWGSQLTSLMNGIVTKLNALPQNIGAVELQAPEEGGAAGCTCASAEAPAGLSLLQRRQQRKRQQQQRRQQLQRMQEERRGSCSSSGAQQSSPATFPRRPLLPSSPQSAADSPSSVLTAAAAAQQAAAAAQHTAAAAASLPPLLVDFS